VKLYELAAGNSDVRMSPHCWKIRMALAHKGIGAQTIPWRFTDKEAIAFSGQGRVPVLVNNDDVVADSWAIAGYLDATYKSKPDLFAGEADKSLALFVNHWSDSSLLPAIAKLIMMDLYNALAECDREYFRETREKALGQSLETFAANREAAVEVFRRLLAPLRMTLESQPYLCGSESGYADYCVFGAFMWARGVSEYELLESQDPLHRWRNSLLDAFGGEARNAVRALS